MDICFYRAKVIVWCFSKNLCGLIAGRRNFSPVNRNTGPFFIVRMPVYFPKGRLVKNGLELFINIKNIRKGKNEKKNICYKLCF